MCLNSHDYPAAHTIILDSRHPADWILTDAQAHEMLNVLLTELDREIPENATVAQWLDMYDWLTDTLCWGSEMLSVKSPHYWHWTPLTDLGLIRLYWQVPAEKKSNSTFIRDVTNNASDGNDMFTVDRKKKHLNSSGLSIRTQNIKLNELVEPRFIWGLGQTLQLGHL